MSLNKFTDTQKGRDLNLDIGCRNLDAENINQPIGGNLSGHNVLARNRLEYLTGDTKLVNLTTPDRGQPNYSLHTDGVGACFWSPDDTGSGDITYNGVLPAVLGKHLKISDTGGTMVNDSKLLEDPVDLNMGGLNITNVGLVDGEDVSALSTQVGTNTTDIGTNATDITGKLSLDGTSLMTGDLAMNTNSISGVVNINGVAYPPTPAPDASKLSIDGSIAMTGALDMGTQAITNVGLVDGEDVSALGTQVGTNTTNISNNSSAILNKLDKDGGSNLRISKPVATITLKDTFSMGASSGELTFTDSTDTEIGKISAPTGNLSLEQGGVEVLSLNQSSIVQTVNGDAITISAGFAGTNYICPSTRQIGIGTITTNLRTLDSSTQFDKDIEMNAGIRDNSGGSNIIGGGGQPFGEVRAGIGAFDTVKLNDATVNAVSIQANPATTSYPLILPAVQSVGVKVLENDGAGNLSWASAGGGGDFLADGSVPMTGNLQMGTNDINLGSNSRVGNEGFGGVDFVDNGTINFRISTSETIFQKFLNLQSGINIGFPFTNSNDIGTVSSQLRDLYTRNINRLSTGFPLVLGNTTDRIDCGSGEVRSSGAVVSSSYAPRHTMRVIADGVINVGAPLTSSLTTDFRVVEIGTGATDDTPVIGYATTSAGGAGVEIIMSGAKIAEVQLDGISSSSPRDPVEKSDTTQGRVQVSVVSPGTIGCACETAVANSVIKIWIKHNESF